MLNARLLDHFQNPRHAGDIADANAVAETSNPVCGDILKLWARIERGVIVRVSFKCRGCTASIACASALTELISGLSVEAARAITAADVESAVGDLETTSKHAASLAVDTLQRLLDVPAGKT